MFFDAWQLEQKKNYEFNFDVTLGDELDEVVIIAHTHGWRSKRFVQGLALRTKIAEIEKEMG